MDEQKKTVEKLLAAADDAEARGDIETAKELLTRCQKLAPFRSDVRERLETLLEKLSDEIHAPPKRNPRQEHTAAEQLGILPQRKDAKSETFLADCQPEEGELWNFAAVADRTADENDDLGLATTDTDVNGEDIRLESSEHEFVAESNTNRNTQVGSSSLGARQSFASGGRKRSLAGISSPTAKKSQATQAQNPKEALFSWRETHDWRQEWQRWLPHVSPRAQAIFAVYGSIALFLIVSSTVSYRKFFRQKLADPVGMVVAQSSTSPPALPGGGRPALQPDGESLQILRLAKDYVRQQRYEEAATLLSNQIDRVADSGLKATYAEELARTYDLLGTSLLEKNKLLQAVSAYEKAVRLAPSSANYLLHLANAHYYCGILLQTEDARRYLQLADQEVSKVLAQDPRSLDAYHLQASVREKLQNIEGALAALTKIIELAPPASQEAIAAREKKNRLSQAR